MQEVQGLQDHVGKLRVGDAGLQSLFDGFLVQHIGYIEEFPVVPEEINDGQVFGPVQVVDHLETEQIADLPVQGFVVVCKDLRCQHASFTCSLRIANESCRTANEHDGMMTVFLQTFGHQEAGIVPDVQGIGRGICTNIKCQFPVVDFIFEIGAGHVVDETAPLQFFK